MEERRVKVTILKGNPLIGDKHYEPGQEVEVSLEKAANLAAAGVIAQPASVDPWPAAEPLGNVLDIENEPAAPSAPAESPPAEPPPVEAPPADKPAAPSPAPLKPAKTSS